MLELFRQVSSTERSTREVFSWLVFNLPPIDFYPPSPRSSEWRVSAICARNIASIIGQADSPLIKTGRDRSLFFLDSRVASYLSLPSPTFSFLNLVTSDTALIDRP